MTDYKDTLYGDGKVIKGKLKLENQSSFEAGLSRFEGERVIVRVDKWTPKRSLAANSYYFGCIVSSIEEWTGYRKEEVHAILKSKFAVETKFIVNEGTGEILEEVTVPLKTSRMSKKEFAEYIDKCEEFCVSLGIELQPFNGDRYANPTDD